MQKWDLSFKAGAISELVADNSLPSQFAEANQFIKNGFGTKEGIRSELADNSLLSQFPEANWSRKVNSAQRTS